MRRWIRNIQWMILYLIVWIILFERFDALILISGIFVSTLCLYFTEKYLTGTSYYDDYPLNIFWVLKYLFFLLIEIYKAGFNTLIKTITGNVNPGVVDIETRLTNDFFISILANSITLTPGTVTLDKTCNQLKVLWLDVETKDKEEAGKLIKGNLERHFEEIIKSEKQG